MGVLLPRVILDPRLCIEDPRLVDLLSRDTGFDCLGFFFSRFASLLTLGECVLLIASPFVPEFFVRTGAGFRMGGLQFVFSRDPLVRFRGCLDPVSRFWQELTIVKSSWPARAPNGAPAYFTDWPTRNLCGIDFSTPNVIVRRVLAMNKLERRPALRPSRLPLLRPALAPSRLRHPLIAADHRHCCINVPAKRTMRPIQAIGYQNRKLRPGTAWSLIEPGAADTGYQVLPSS